MSNTNFPGAIDTGPANPSTSDTLASNPHHLQHGFENDAVIAVETKLGSGASSQTPVNNSFLVGNGTGTSQWQTSPTSPSFTTSILDTNGKTWIGQTATANAVNYVNIANAATTNSPAISALGTDSNIGLNLVPKGSGVVQDNGTNLIDFRTSFFDFVKTGGIWTAGSGLQASMTAMTLFIGGVEYSVGAITNHAFTASQDTYIDYTVGTGITYTAVNNNAASPALAANSLRIAIVVTGASTVSSINQGSPGATAPIASGIIYSVSDSLGNLIYPNDPSRRLLGYRQVTSSFTTTSATAVQITGLSCPVIVPTNRKVHISFGGIVSVTGNTAIISIWDGVVVSGTQLSATKNASTTVIDTYLETIAQPSSANKTYNIGVLIGSAQTFTLESTATELSFIKVELQ